jgi:uncharacterized protein (TIGR02145 family)/prepilin-type N-terminal cleavage/methylation domain-containing protein
MKSGTSSRHSFGFTIVELLVVIVVIGILATITVVSYTGVSQKATTASLTSDLDNASKQLKLYQVDHSTYPTSLDGNNCPQGSAPTPDTRYCIKPSSNNSYTYYPSTNGATFRLVESNANSVTYSVTESRSPSVTIATTDTGWLAIGSQLWAKTNLNVGTMVTGATAQTNNSTLEKYCYSNTESNCTTYGGLYQWDEAMQYVTTNGAQGICPAGSHIPSDNDWKILEVQLGITQAQADLDNTWRGTDQGTQLKSGGSSGLNMPLAGYRGTGGSFDYLSSYALLWSSSELSTSALGRYLYSDYATVLRDIDGKYNGFSVRCLGN